MWHHTGLQISDQLKRRKYLWWYKQGNAIGDSFVPKLLHQNTRVSSNLVVVQEICFFDSKYTAIVKFTHEPLNWSLYL